MKRRPRFQYTPEQQQLIIEQLKPLQHNVEPTDVVDWLTDAAARAILVQHSRRPFAGEATRVLAKTPHHRDNATRSNAADRIVATLPRTGRPFDEARFQFGIALYEIFEKATGRRPSGATPTDSWEEGGAFFRFVEEAIGPTQLLGDAGVKSSSRTSSYGQELESYHSQKSRR
jgi:hypothetical protein